MQIPTTASLSLDDVSLDTSTSCWFFLLTIKASKTDQFCQGATVALGSTGTDLCPVDVVFDYLGRRGNLVGPHFCLETEQPLQRRSFTSQVQQALFNGHSFRLGAATSASIAGVSESIIKCLGKWQSSAYQQYIRTPPSDLARISQQLVASDSSTNP